MSARLNADVAIWAREIAHLLASCEEPEELWARLEAKVKEEFHETNTVAEEFNSRKSSQNGSLD